MTTPQFIRFVEEGLTRAGVGKVLPDAETLAAAYAAIKAEPVVETAIEKTLAELAAAAAKPPPTSPAASRRVLTSGEKKVGTRPCARFVSLCPPGDQVKHARRNLQNRGKTHRPSAYYSV